MGTPGGPSLPCGVDMLKPGVVAGQAAAIAVPVLIAQGERDVVPHPRDEPAAYSYPPTHVTMVRIPAMAILCITSPRTREQMWRAIHAWGQSLLPWRIYCHRTDQAHRPGTAAPTQPPAGSALDQRDGL